MPSGTPRFLPLPNQPPNQLKDWESLNKDIASALLVEIRSVQSYANESRISRHDSVYTGIAGIAFMEYHIAQTNPPVHDEFLVPQYLIETADRNLARVLHHNPINIKYMYSPTRLSFMETFIGVATLVLVRAPLTSEQTILDNQRAAKEYLEYTLGFTLSAENTDRSTADNLDECEVLYGRAGMLYALLYLRNAFHDWSEEDRAPFQQLISDAALAKLVDSIMASGRRGGALLASEFKKRDAVQLPPLMWAWHGKRYLGAAHGVAGILQMLLSCPFALIQDHMGDILKTVDWLVELQDENANWPSHCPDRTGVSPKDNEVVQWCHGAPGVVILLSKTLHILRTHKNVLHVTQATLDKLYQSLHRGAHLVYNQGLLRKGVGLCHGVSGNVYALLSASDILDKGSTSPNSSSTITDLSLDLRKCFSKAAHLAFLGKFYNDPSVLPGMRTPDHPWSLYEGMAGMCCAWAEVLCRMDTKSPRRKQSGFPAYDDL